MFLGLVLGPQPVELTVTDGRVTTVEIVLDGKRIARIEKPPWRTICELGPELLPHELLAIARDEEGSELARVRQWLNLPRDMVEATLVVGDRPDGGRVARLAWYDVYAANPVELEVFFDGQTLAFDDPQQIRLPPHDLSSIHLLRAELEFPNRRRAAAEVMFGGIYGTEVRSELTAVAVELEHGKLPPIASMQSWFSKDGQALPIAAIEGQGYEMLLVVDQGAIGKLATMLAPTRGVGHRHFSGHRRYPQLKPDQRLRFLLTVPELVTNQAHSSALFKPTRRFTRDDGSLLYLFRWLQLSDLPSGPQRLSDAVAVAGRMVYRLGHPRLVVLVISEDPVDASSLSPATVRRYLASLGVPLVVWSPAHERVRESPWGEVEWIETTNKLRQALNRVSDRLDKQRIVWLEGLHLPQQITLSPAVQNLRMAR